MVTNVIVFIAGSFVGGFITYFFTLRQDKRKEFNEAADILYHSLTEFKTEIENDSYGYKREPAPKEFKDLKRKLPFYKVKRFEKAVNNYKKAISEENRYQDAYGSPHIKNRQIIISALNELLKFTTRKKF